MKTPSLSSLFATLSLLAIPAFGQTADSTPTVVPANPANAPGARLILPFNSGWNFHLYTAADSAPNAAPANYTWSTVNLPYDWSVAGPFDENAPAARGGAYLPTGAAAFRKSFTLPAEDASRRVEIQFDGIMANGEVIINGHSVGKRPSGYISVNYDLTPFLHFGPGQVNTLDVSVNNSIQHASRYYTGSGIERNVRLVVTNPVHVDTWGTYVTTTDMHLINPQAGGSGVPNASLHIETSVTNSATTPHTVTVNLEMSGPTGNAVKVFAPMGRPYQAPAAQTLAPGQSATFTQDVLITDPKLWDLDTPNLYQAIAQIVEDGKSLDTSAATFGIRKIEFKPESGFWLNGKNIKILGIGIHADGGAVGEAVPRSIYETRVAAMKNLGANALRIAHNPPDPVLLDVCDHLGVLVMDEMYDCWTVGKPDAEQGYNLFFNEWSLKDLHDAVVRDRNHPSIILWSAGNEIHDTPQEAKALGILTGLMKEFHQDDPSRPVTQALFRPSSSHDYTNGLADLLDVVGTNYRDNELVAAQRAVPTRKILSTEEKQDQKTWVYVRDTPALSGCFLWSGIDYLGEGNPPNTNNSTYAWPNISSGSGMLDRALNPKPAGLERESWWSTKPVVHIVRSTDRNRNLMLNSVPNGTSLNGLVVGLHDWTPQVANNYSRATIYILSNCEEVELFLNGQSLGSKPAPRDASPRTFDVTYAPGTLLAIGKNGGQEVAREQLQTAGAPTKITLSAERTKIAPSFDDVVIVRATVTDDKGVQVPFGDNAITFKTTGPGAVIATDNGKPDDHTVFPSPTRTTKDGTCVAFIRATAATGPITLTASADGLQAGTVTLETIPAKAN